MRTLGGLWAEVFARPEPTALPDADAALYSGFLDHETLKPEKVKPDVAALFAAVDLKKSGSLIMHGWVMAEDLVKLGQR